MKKTKRFKRLNKKVNNTIQAANEIIMLDPVWKGRFVVRSIKKTVFALRNNWGYRITHLLELKDLKTGRTKQVTFSNFEELWELLHKIDIFICVDCFVWGEKPRPSLLSPDYTNGKRIQLLERKRKNFSKTVPESDFDKSLEL